jgi:hypothetical protein
MKYALSVGRYGNADVWEAGNAFNIHNVHVARIGMRDKNIVKMW